MSLFFSGGPGVNISPRPNNILTKRLGRFLALSQTSVVARVVKGRTLYPSDHLP